jgi:hypothetical protein
MKRRACLIKNEPTITREDPVVIFYTHNLLTISYTNKNNRDHKTNNTTGIALRNLRKQTHALGTDCVLPANRKAVLTETCYM